MKIFLVGGTRPNFIKLAPLVRACRKFDAEHKVINTGQHYDFNLSDVFFDELEINEPDYNLDVGSSTHGDQTAKIMQRFEKVCFHDTPDIVVVVGDVNSTMACSLVVAKMPDVKLAHVEAGLRCLDRSKPEEVNRVVTDTISNYLFATISYACANLLSENIPRKDIFLVGDVVIDNLIHYLPKIESNNRDYVLATIHRPYSTDDPKNLKSILTALLQIAIDVDVIFPIHPRTKSRIEEFGLTDYARDIHFTEPVGYFEFLSLMVNAKAVVSDSGGVQVETTYLGKPCVSVMQTTSHSYTLNRGTNMLANYENIYDVFKTHDRSEPYRDKYADGKAAERIIKCLIES